MESDWLALDIGGANLKAADGQGFVEIRPFPLWKSRELLAGALSELIDAAPTTRRYAVTMTGELADCFDDKSEGVRHILKSTRQAISHGEISVYQVTGRFVDSATACDNVDLTAASNWHALATFAGRYLIGRRGWSALEPRPSHRPVEDGGDMGVMIDIGSTTTDIIPLSGPKPLTPSRTDTDRLLRGELVYTGVRRSPVCAVTNVLPWRGELYSVAQELFATTADAYLLLGALPENAKDMTTADGRPLTRTAAHARMARMLCLDRLSFNLADAISAAAAVHSAQLARLSEALQCVLSRLPQAPQHVLVSGEGEFLARRLVAGCLPDMNVISLASLLGADVSRAAPAHALAVLAREWEAEP